MVQVETYITHKSFSSLEGGFKLKINGVQIYKVTPLLNLQFMINFYIPTIQEHNDELTKDFDRVAMLH